MVSKERIEFLKRYLEPSIKRNRDAYCLPHKIKDPECLLGVSVLLSLTCLINFPTVSVTKKSDRRLLYIKIPHSEMKVLKSTYKMGHHLSVAKSILHTHYHSVYNNTKLSIVIAMEHIDSYFLGTF